MPPLTPMTHRRLVIPVLAALALPALADGAPRAEANGARRPVESPAAFVLPPARRAPTIAQRAVVLARTQLGVPYRWGGASPAGFDCSGLVSWAYGRLGVTLPHNAAALYDVGRPVPPTALRAGDLIFFDGLGHVGMYVGGGRMIHAPQSGRRVEIQPLAAREGGILGARRVTARG